MDIFKTCFNFFEGGGFMINVAIFGAGRIGNIHASNLVKQSGIKLKYVSDIHEVSAKTLADKYAATVANTDQIFDDKSIDAVVIASSTDTHAELILRAVQANKAIFCEKPVDLNVQKAKECLEAVEKAGVLCMVGFQRRFDPTFAALKKRLAEGEIGVAEMLMITSRDPAAPPASYIQSSGGIFKDMLIHDFDVFRWILEDEAVSISAMGSCLTDERIAELGDADSTIVNIKTHQGRLCQIDTSRRAIYGYDQRFEVLGSQGMLQAGNHRPTQVVLSSTSAISYDKPEHFFLERYREAYALEMAHFFEAMMTNEPVRTTIRDGVKALELAEAAALSWREHRTVRL